MSDRTFIGNAGDGFAPRSKAADRTRQRVQLRMPGALITMKDEMTQGILVAAFSSVPRIPIDECSEAVRAWIGREMRRNREIVGPDDVDTYMARQTAFGSLAGVAVGILEACGEEARDASIRVGCGSERENLHVFNNAIAGHEGAVVLYSGDMAAFRFAAGRLLASGMRPHFDVVETTRRVVDLADVFSPNTDKIHPPLHVLCDAFELHHWEEPLDLTVVTAAARRGNREIVAGQLLRQLQAVSCLYASTFGGGLQLQPLPFDESAFAE